MVLGPYRLVTLLAEALTREGPRPVQQTAWYHKEQATFSDVLAVVRREVWGNFRFCTSPDNPDLLLIPRAVLEQLAFAVCYCAGNGQSRAKGGFTNFSEDPDFGATYPQLRFGKSTITNVQICHYQP